MLRKISKDTFSTLCGLVGAALLQGGTYYATGGFTKEAALAGAVIGIGGYLHNKGKTEPVTESVDISKHMPGDS